LSNPLARKKLLPNLIIHITMSEYANKSAENRSIGVSDDHTVQQYKAKSAIQLADNRPAVVAQRKVQAVSKNSNALINGMTTQFMMKRSGRVQGNLNDLGSINNATQVFTHGTVSRTVHIGQLRHFLGTGDLYSLRERMLEDIGGNSKGHQHITGNASLLDIYYQVCDLLGIGRDQINLDGISKSTEDESSDKGGGGGGGESKGGDNGHTGGGGGTSAITV